VRGTGSSVRVLQKTEGGALWRGSSLGGKGARRVRVATWCRLEIGSSDRSGQGGRAGRAGPSPRRPPSKEDADADEDETGAEGK
jgi:hypothetical protein